MIARHRKHPTVGVAGVVHEPSWRAQFLAIDHVDRVVADEKVQVEEVAVGVFGCSQTTADVGGLEGDYLAKVDVDELTCADEIW